MSKKPRKVEEPKSPYPAKPAGGGVAASVPGIRYADVKKIRATNAHLVKVHRDVLEKLAR